MLLVFLIILPILIFGLWFFFRVGNNRNNPWMKKYNLVVVAALMIFVSVDLYFLWHKMGVDRGFYPLVAIIHAGGISGVILILSAIIRNFFRR